MSIIYKRNFVDLALIISISFAKLPFNIFKPCLNLMEFSVSTVMITEY